RRRSAAAGTVHRARVLAHAAGTPPARETRWTCPSLVAQATAYAATAAVAGVRRNPPGGGVPEPTPRLRRATSLWTGDTGAGRLTSDGRRTGGGVREKEPAACSPRPGNKNPCL